MIADNETNVIYFSELIKTDERSKQTFAQISKILNDYKVTIKFLPGTKDIWARDYMPVQVSQDKFVQFRYNPDYLQLPEFCNTISNVDEICRKIGLKTLKSKIFIDGGNVVKTKNKVIMTEKVFWENKNIPEKELIRQLKALFEVDKIFFLPWDVVDIYGHADGWVRFINDDAVLINDFYLGQFENELSFKLSLHNAGFDWIELPYNAKILLRNKDDARGMYLNYLETEKLILMPVYHLKSDDKAYKVLQENFPDKTILTVDCNKLSEDGGILNCISWSIKQ